VADANIGLGSNHDLLARIGQRDVTALAELYDRYGARIYAIACRMTSDNVAAEQLVIDVFQTVWQSVERGQAYSSVTAWLLVIVRDRSRAMTPRHGNHVPDGALGRNGVHEAPAPLQWHGDVEEAVPHIQAAFAALPIVQRHAIELAYYDGLTQDAIAARFKIPVHTVKTALRLGLMRLHERRDTDGQSQLRERER
jgi:RNA polymerase sigma-70 factor, ECF subfamily